MHITVVMYHAWGAYPYWSDVARSVPLKVQACDTFLWITSLLIPFTLCFSLFVCWAPFFLLVASVAHSTLIHKVGNTTLRHERLVVLSTLWMSPLSLSADADHGELSSLSVANHCRAGPHLSLPCPHPLTAPWMWNHRKTLAGGVGWPVASDGFVILLKGRKKHP